MEIGTTQFIRIANPTNTVSYCLTAPKDIDFLVDGISNDPQALAEIFAVLVTREYGDGLSFDVGSIRSERITEVAEYHGVRLHMRARLGTVWNTIQVDVGFGDALEGGPRSTILRKLLDDTPLVIITCPLATVLAEKLESTITLGNVNSRMKDLYDLWFILEHVSLSDQEILAATRATFARRRTVMPDGPAVFSREYVDSERTELLWQGFTRRSKLGNLELSSILDIIKTRLEPLYAKLRLMQDWPPAS